MFKSFFQFIIFFFIFFNYTLADNFYWIKKNGSWILKLNKNILYNESQKNIIFPSNLNQIEQIEFILNLSEYFFLKKKNQDYQQLKKVVEKRNDFIFLKILLNHIQKTKKNDSLDIINKNIKKSDNKYIKNLLISFKNYLEDRKKNFSFECSTKLPYYSICFILKLKYFLDKFNSSKKNNTSEYHNLIRMTGIFIENKKLKSVPFLNLFIPNLSEKLAALGLIKMAIHFQKNQILKKNIEIGINSYSYELLSYFYLLDSNSIYAKKIFIYLLKYKNNIPFIKKNQYYLKLGLIATLEKKYKESLEYYSKIKFSHWSNKIYNPLTGEPLSINLARDLISYSVWKEKGKYRALNLIRKTSFPDRLTEDDLLVKIRALQILNSKPKLSQKFAQKISFYAQSKKWKRAEYYSTLINGYYFFKLKKNKKAIIEFTKLKKILDKKDNTARFNLDRSIGLFLARRNIKSKNQTLKYFAKKIQKELYLVKKNEILNELKKYSPVDFSINKIEQEIIDFFHNQNMSESLLQSFVENDFLKMIYKKNFLNYHISNIIYANYKYSILQNFSSSKNSLSLYTRIRKNQANILFNTLKPYRTVEKWKKHTLPFIAIFFKPKKVYLFYKNVNSPLNHIIIEANRLKKSKTKRILKKIINSFYPTSKVQIYFNPDAMKIMDSLQIEYKNIQFQYFYMFQLKNLEKIKYIPIVPSCSKISENKKFKSVGLEYIEGKKVLNLKNTLYLWVLKANSTNEIDNLIFSCKNNKKLIFSNLQRRIDFRTKPEALLFNTNSFKELSFQKRNMFIQSWLYFWLWSKTKTIFYSSYENRNVDSLLESISSKEKKVKKINFYIE